MDTNTSKTITNWKALREFKPPPMIFTFYSWLSPVWRNRNSKLEIAAQGVAQCKVSAMHVVVDVALRRIG